MEKSRSLKIGGYTLPLNRESMQHLDATEHSVSLEPIVFSFQFRSVHFKCMCDHVGQSTPFVSLTAKLGAVPYTAQSPYARQATLTIAKAANKHLAGSVTVSNGVIYFETTTPIESPVTSTSLVTSIVIAMAKIDPYITLLGQIISVSARG